MFDSIVAVSQETQTAKEEKVALPFCIPEIEYDKKKGNSFELLTRAMVVVVAHVISCSSYGFPLDPMNAIDRNEIDYFRHKCGANVHETRSQL